MPGTKDRDRPQPDLSRGADENEIMALGLITGAIAVSPIQTEKGAIVSQVVLANRDNEVPRLFVRFPAVLLSEYEVVLRRVPGSEIADGPEQVDG